MSGLTWISTTVAARIFGVSTRRVRFLIESGRLVAQRGDRGRWSVLYPFQLTLGTRGPRLGTKSRRPLT